MYRAGIIGTGSSLPDRVLKNFELEELVTRSADELDAAYARGWLERIVGKQDPRHRRLCEVLDRYA